MLKNIEHFEVDVIVIIGHSNTMLPMMFFPCTVTESHNMTPANLTHFPHLTILFWQEN